MSAPLAVEAEAEWVHWVPWVCAVEAEVLLAVAVVRWVVVLFAGDGWFQVVEAVHQFLEVHAVW